MMHTQTRRDRAHPRQSGAVLIMSLLILFLLTIIGLSAMSRSTMDEKMTSNMRDKQVAFEAAEYALRQGESVVANLATPSSFNQSNGLYGLYDTEPDYSASGTWTSNASVPVGTSISGAKTQPRYFAKIISEVQAKGSAANISGYPGSVATTYYIRITARGTGISDNSQVILREIYAKEF